MRYSFTGTRAVSNYSPEAARMKSYLATLTNGTEFTTGGQWGVDVIAADELMSLFPEALHRVVVPMDAPYAEAAVRELERRGALVLVGPPADSAGHAYRKRNEELVRYADMLVAFPQHPEFEARSGTWMTINIAAAADVRVAVLAFDEEEWV